VQVVYELLILYELQLQYSVILIDSRAAVSGLCLLNSIITDTVTERTQAPKKPTVEKRSYCRANALLYFVSLNRRQRSLRARGRKCKSTYSTEYRYSKNTVIATLELQLGAGGLLTLLLLKKGV
jgi:hypothetical protein